MRLLLALASLLICSACQAKTRQVAATQVVVRIDAAKEVRERAKLLRVRAAVQDTPESKWSERPMFELPVGQLKQGQKDFWPVDIPVSPRRSDAPAWLFELVIEAVSTDGAPLVQARVLAGFVRESERMVTVVLEACGEQALGTLCESDPTCHGHDCQSCQQGHCADTTEMIRSELLEPLEREPKTSPQGVDAGPSDAGHAGSAGGAGGAGGTHGDGGDSGMAGRAGGGAAGASMPPPARMETWSAPERVDTGTSAVAVPVAANNAAGDTVIGYRQDEAGGFLWLRRFVRGAWDEAAFAPNGLVPSATQRVVAASLGMDSSGAAQLLYEDGQPKTLWLHWQGEASLSEAAPPLVLGDQTLADIPNLTVSEDGDATALWVASRAQDGTTARAVFMNRRERDTWQSPSKIGDTGATPRSYGFCENGTGDFVAIFAAQDTASNGAPGPNTLKSFVAAGSAVTTPSVFALQAPTLPSGFPCALDRAGNATSIFVAGTDSMHLQLYWSRLEAGDTSWTEAAELSERFVQSAQVVADADDGAVAVWQERDAADAKKRRIVARRYRPANGWGELEEIAPAFDSEGESFELARAPEGRLIAAWTQPQPQPQPGSDAKLLRVSRSNVASMWSDPRDISAVAPDAQIVKLTVDRDDNALIVWGQTPKDGATHLMWSRSTWSAR